MNRFPVWKYTLIAIVILAAFVYTVPNFFGESPAVQVSSAKSTVKVDTALLARVEDILKKESIPYSGAQVDATGVRVRFADPDTQLRAKDLIERALNAGTDEGAYTVALNLLPASPSWLARINALPMYLGLDLRGGVHFLLQIDMPAASLKRIENLAADVRSQLREKNIRHGGVAREGQAIRVRFRDPATREAARGAILANIPDLALAERDDGQDLLLVGTLRPEVLKRVQETAVQQNISTLHNRVNELGVAEPVIQQQGADRIVVQLPGVQDIARAKEILGRTATLEVRLVDEEAMRSGNTFGADVFPERRRDGSVGQVPTKKQVIVTGDQFVGAQATFDQDHRPAVAVELDQAGGRAMRITTRENLKRLMAIVLFEKNKGEAISVATIQGEFGSRFQITGSFTPVETNNLALLIRAGALAAPMEFVDERTVGPSLGKENVERGMTAVLYSFSFALIFFLFYYRMFGVITCVALLLNLLMVIAVMSFLGATLTLPGLAGIALTVGMSVDANVLINERIREELRLGMPPLGAIKEGYERAAGTIADANITAILAGVALFAFGTGPVKGFAVSLIVGIATSMYTAVSVSRGIATLIYGHRRKLKSIAV